jgi:hypothetical protein
MIKLSESTLSVGISDRRGRFDNYGGVLGVNDELRKRFIAWVLVCDHDTGIFSPTKL